MSLARRFPGWRRLSAPGDKLRAVWTHATSRWRVEHCGHPTALWPYCARSPHLPGKLVASHTGRGFSSLAHAFEQVEAVLRGDLALYDDGPCKHGHRVVIADPFDPDPWIVDRLAEIGDPRVFELVAHADDACPCTAGGPCEGGPI